MLETMVKHSLMHPLAFHPYKRPLASSTGKPDAQEEEVVTNFSLAGTLSPARTRIRRRPRKADISNETDSEEEGAGTSTLRQLDNDQHIGPPAFVELQPPLPRSLPPALQLDGMGQGASAGQAQKGVSISD